MQNAGPLPSCSRESWANSSFKSQEKPWGHIRTSDGFYGVQTTSSSKMLNFDQGRVVHENLQENVAPASMASWPAAYSFSEGFSVKETESGVAEAEMERLLRNGDVGPQELRFESESASAGCLHSAYGLKVEEMSTSDGVSVQPFLHRPNLISFSANAKDVVKDSAAVVSGDELSQSFLGRTDKCEESDHKRSCAVEEGEQGGPSKRNRTSDAPKFKVQVRKEKLGERITALQQLVSPFGKTDTASVLLEAIGYIKFLQDQVQVLSTPYIKGLPSSQTQDGRRGDSAVGNLRGRGLCLVPISSTQLMANDNGADYWASGIGGGTRF